MVFRGCMHEVTSPGATLSKKEANSTEIHRTESDKYFPTAIQILEGSSLDPSEQCLPNR